MFKRQHYGQNLFSCSKFSNAIAFEIHSCIFYFISIPVGSFCKWVNLSKTYGRISTDSNSCSVCRISNFESRIRFHSFSLRSVESEIHYHDDSCRVVYAHTRTVLYTQRDEIRCTDIQKLSETFFRLLATNINNAWHLTGVECSVCVYEWAVSVRGERENRNCLTSWIVVLFVFHQYGVCICQCGIDFGVRNTSTNAHTHTHMQWLKRNRLAYRQRCVCVC